MRGLRVLGLGIREISNEEAELLVQESTPRSKVEENLSFFGLLIMENKLKSDTSAVIGDLMQSGLDIKIISGDNGLTTV
jgi:cation-transporting ATPase 13A3/4/5